MRILRELTFFGAAMVWATGSAVAQESTPPTAPEMRDFRLEPKAEQPAPKVEATPAPIAVPTPTPDIAPPAAAPATVKQTPKPKVAIAPVAKPAVVQSGPVAGPRAAPIATTPAPADVTNTTLPESPEPVDTTATVEPVPDAPFIVPSVSPVGQWPIWIWAIPPFLLGAIAVLWFRRRKTHFVSIDSDAEIDLGEDADYAPNPAVQPTAPQRLVLQFEVTHAQLSLANMTVTGKLSIQNTSDGPVRDLAVRTAMISASDQQSDAIRRFQTDENQTHNENLGIARAGEEIALSLEIQQPRSALQLFDWRQRQFVAPIILVHLSGKGPQGEEVVSAAFLLGRPGSNGSAKLTPLHVDRGPRSFTALSTRLLAH